MEVLEAPKPGFNFENCKRNAFLASEGFKPPKVTRPITYRSKYEFKVENNIIILRCLVIWKRVFLHVLVIFIAIRENYIKHILGYQDWYHHLCSYLQGKYFKKYGSVSGVGKKPVLSFLVFFANWFFVGFIKTFFSLNEITLKIEYDRIFIYIKKAT